METCVLQQSLQVITTTTTGQGTELGSNRLTTEHQDNASTTDTNTSTGIINNRKSSSASLSDLIPAAAAALRTRQELQRSQCQTGDNNKGDPLYSAKTTFQDSAFYSHQQQPTTNSTPFARALTKVKLQVQTKRLKERYLSHEWIRLALSLPVDLSRINIHHCYYLREQVDNVGKQRKSTQTGEKADTMTLAPTPTSALSSAVSPPSPAPSDATTSSSLLLKDDNKQQQQDNQMEIHTHGRSIPAPTSATTTPPASPSSSRTGEIATWYEWKFDRNKFSVEEVQCKVDRLRTTKMTTKVRDKQASSPSI